MSENHIEKRLELKASIARVWRALTDYREFGEWFCIKTEGPFVVGQKSHGLFTYSKSENLKWEIFVKKMEHEKLFAFTWHPYAVDPKMDYSGEESTLVEFRLEKNHDGTLLTVAESGFDSLPASRRDEAFRMNSEGWKIQLENIKKYVNG